MVVPLLVCNTMFGIDVSSVTVTWLDDTNDAILPHAHEPASGAGAHASCCTPPTVVGLPGVTPVLLMIADHHAPEASVTVLPTTYAVPAFHAAGCENRRRWRPTSVEANGVVVEAVNETVPVRADTVPVSPEGSRY